jgi:hypothetical protein
VLEHLVDPWRVVANIRPHLKDTGKVLASIPNIMHVSVMRGLLNGRFSYQDAGILDRTHLRFFTLTEIDGLFAGAGYGPRHYSATSVPLTEEDLQFVNSLKSLSTSQYVGSVSGLSVPGQGGQVARKRLGSSPVGIVPALGETYTSQSSTEAAPVPYCARTTSCIRADP